MNTAIAPNAAKQRREMRRNAVMPIADPIPMPSPATLTAFSAISLNSAGLSVNDLTFFRIGNSSMRIHTINHIVVLPRIEENGRQC